jgi:hypothetical protein
LSIRVYGGSIGIVAGAALLAAVVYAVREPVSKLGVAWIHWISSARP